MAPCSGPNKYLDCTPMDGKPSSLQNWSPAEVAFQPQTLLRTCSAEDLVVMKAFAARAKDWLDVEGIIVRQTGKLDWPYICGQLQPLAELKEAPEIMDELARRRTEFEGGPHRAECCEAQRAVSGLRSLCTKGRRADGAERRPPARFETSIHGPLPRACVAAPAVSGQCSHSHALTPSRGFRRASLRSVRPTGAPTRPALTRDTTPLS